MIISSGAITANFRQNIIPLNITILAENAGMESYRTYVIDESDGINLQACFLFHWYSIRDNGQVNHNEDFEECFSENERFMLSFSYDDGRGNSEEIYIQKNLSFTLSKDGKVIYSGNTEPENGSIHNGYQIHINYQNL